MLIYHFFFFNDTATTEIYTLSLHDALPIWPVLHDIPGRGHRNDLDPLGSPIVRLADRLRHHTRLGEGKRGGTGADADGLLDRKSTRLNSSHANISYAVFCLKKKKTTHLRFH